jgi:hypothetical protein
MLGFNGGLIGKDRSTSALASVPGVWTLGEQLKAKRSLLWPPNAGEDSYFDNVSLLLRGNGINGSTTIVDESATPKTVTAFGDAQISTAQSKFGGASMLFDGTGDYLSVSDATAFDFLTEDYTLECWIRLTSITDAALAINFGSQNIYFGVIASGANRFLTSYNGVLVLEQTSGTSLSLNQWHHIAYSRASSQARIFLDGTLVASATNSASINVSTAQIGSSPAYPSLYFFNGYIDDLRITKGIARYTANFTPPGAL